MTEPDPAPPTRRQMNVRLPADLIAEVDIRRQKKDLSRDVWVERALRYALSGRGAPLTAPGKRTATPNTRRRST